MSSGASRYSTPDGPSPLLAVDVQTGGSDPCPPNCNHDQRCWTMYPCGMFDDWTYQQVVRTGLSIIMQPDGRAPGNAHGAEPPRRIHKFDIMMNGRFSEYNDQYLEKQQPPSENVRIVRVLCLQNLTGAELWKTGSTYRIYPSFFLSSAGLRCYESLSKLDNGFILRLPFAQVVEKSSVDTQEVFHLSNGSTIVRQVLRIYMTEKAVISSFCTIPPRRIFLACKSIYWKSRFAEDMQGMRGYAELVLLVYLWHVVSAWDESLRCLHTHATAMEKKVIKLPNAEGRHLEELRNIRAELLHYQSFIDDFAFALNQTSLEDGTAKNEKKEVMCAIQRLQKDREIVFNLVTELIGIIFNDANSRLAEAARRDSTAMKRIAYVTTVFLPGSFIAGVFGIDMKQITPDTALVRFVVTTIILTIVTVAILFGIQAAKAMLLRYMAQRNESRDSDVKALEEGQGEKRKP